MLHRRNILIWIAVPLLGLVLNSAGQTTSEVLKLELGRSVEREIVGSQSHQFSVDAAPGRYSKILIEQRGINLFVRLTRAGNKFITEADTEVGTTGSEVLHIYSTSNEILVTVAARNKTAPSGAYKIELVEQRNPTAGETSLDEARSLWLRGDDLWRAGKYKEAQEAAERCVEIRQRELGEEHSEVARAYLLLGNVLSETDNDKAEFFYARSLDIAEKTLGKNHQFIAAVINNWSTIHKRRGDFLKAEAISLRAHDILQKLLDPNSPQIASSMINLGNIYIARGDRRKAAEFYRRALTISENAFGPEHWRVSLALNNLANATDDPVEAERLLLRALAIREKTVGEHQDTADTLYNLAQLYTASDEYEKAEAYCRRSLAMFEKTLGSDHQFVSYPLNLLAAIHKFKGDYDGAETLFMRAVALKEKVSPLHPELGGSLSNLAVVYVLKGNIEKAIATQTRANEILEYNALLNLRIGSEREKLAYAETLDEVDSNTLTLSFRAAANSKVARNLAATSVLRSKGRVLDAMSDSYSALRGRFDLQDQKLFDELGKTTNDLIGLVAGKQLTVTDDYGRQLKELEDKRDLIEDRISKRSAGFFEADKSVTLDEIRALIPQNAALLEFAVYRPVSFKLSGFGFDVRANAFEEPRYAAFIIGASGEIRSKDLGSVSEIDKLVDDLRLALRDPKSTDVKAFARILDEKLLRPLRGFPEGTRHLLIAPDGGLSLLPFETLVDESGKYLIENYSVNYLTSGRDLLRMQSEQTSSRDKSMIVANPTFGVASQTDSSTLASRQAGRKSILATRNLSDTYFAPLAGTIAEARAIRDIFPDTLLLSETTATESSLKRVNAPRILHIATHGFFLETAKQANSGQSRGGKVKFASENPLLRSGIALAGANRRGTSANDDGILTALEASGLNLWGTKLVVLSACDTGLGEVKNGEGVYGLRRAFMLAGTESLVMSLWSVSDYTTRELMTRFYKNLKSGMGRGESLRQAQLDLLKQKGRQHPFYWAAFIHTGEWANLDGKR